MKKLIAFIMILAMLLPAAALAEDPIVGCWYINIDLFKQPEMRASYGNCDRIIDVYIFDESGTITLIEGVITDGACTPSYSAQGKWEKTLSGYNVSIVGFGKTTMTINGEEALLKIPNDQAVNASMKLRRLIPFDMYSDYSF